MAQDRQLVVQGGVEHAVGVLLIGENPRFFAVADTGPHRKRVVRRRRAELHVAHDAPQQADIRRADAVVVVKVQACQGADEHAVDGFRVQSLGQRRIQPVDALDKHHLPFPQANWRAARIALAEFEGERWQQDLAPIQQFRQMLAEERHIQRADGFEVERAVLLQRDAVAVEIVVIQRNHQRLKPDDVQVERQSLGERRLAGRRRPGNQHDFLVLDGNIRRNVGNWLHSGG